MIRSKEFIQTRFATLEEAAKHLAIPVYRLRQMIRTGVVASDKHEKYVSWEQINLYERVRKFHATHQQPELKAKRLSAQRKRTDVRPH